MFIQDITILIKKQVSEILSNMRNTILMKLIYTLHFTETPDVLPIFNDTFHSSLCFYISL